MGAKTHHPARNLAEIGRVHGSISHRARNFAASMFESGAVSSWSTGEFFS